jgi:thioredoxin reductase
MAKVIIIGDGPGGLSAALFLAKNDVEVHVYGRNETAMHFAHLHNYLGAPDISGTAFQHAARAQVAAFGAELHDAGAESVSSADDGVTVTLANGVELAGDYLILSEGKNPILAGSLGLTTDDSGAVTVNSEGLSSDPRVYVVGRSARPSRSQAIISAGDGAKAAIDIMSREAGKDVQDWDTPQKD